MILHIVKHELRLLFREPRFWIPFLLPPLVLLGSQFLITRDVHGELPTEMTGFLLLLLGVISAPTAAPLTADAFAGERERKTLELLQMSPVRASQIFLAKLIAILPFPLLIALLSISLFAKIANLPADYFLKAVFGTIASILFVNGGALLLSLYSKTVRAATQMSVLLFLPLLFLVQLSFRVYFESWLLPVVGLVVAVFSLCASAAVALRKFQQV